MEEAERLKLEHFLHELEGYRGRHTELITVYVPAGYNLNLIAKQIESEKSTAVNIKSKSTRKNVLDGLEKISRHLRLFKQTPKNGLAVFCGNISKVEGQPKIELWSIEPPLPIKVKVYRCDQTFLLEPLSGLLEVKEVYGLVVMDRREATLGVLEGKSIRKLKHLTSGVPGKIKAGGQCLSQDTLLMKDDGDILEIKDSHNPLMLVSENFNKEETEATPLIAKWENKKQLCKIITCYPRIEIKASAYHHFFVRTNDGIEEKPLSQVKSGDYLLMPEKIDLTLEDQTINFVPKIIKKPIKEVQIPSKINPHLAKVLGYYLGDGSYEVDRITFFEQARKVTNYYKKLIENVFNFNIGVKYIFRKSKNYYQLRVYSRIISQFFKSIFSEKDKTLYEKIPSIVLRSSDKSLAAFISGFFDAEGYVSVSSGRVAAGVNNEMLSKQLQLSLLRLGIISSVLEYDNRRNPYSDKLRYTISIDDLESIKKFGDLIGFSDVGKQEKVKELIGKRSNRNKVRQLAVNGKEVARILRNSGMNTTQFMCPDFFSNKKQLSKEVFKKRILSKIKDAALKKRLEIFYNSNLIVVKISSIEKLFEEVTVDIETKNHNFIANCLVVHNSAQRFERLTEGMALEFYRRVGQSVNEQFFEMPKLKGILVGGPGPTKESFLKEGQIYTALKQKIIAVKDIGYTDEFGLNQLVEAAADTLAQEAITKEKEVLKKFFTLLATKPEKIAYGKNEVKKALDLGAVDKLYLSKTLGKKELEELAKAASETSAGIFYISTETKEGVQFKNLGGVGAILRFAVE